MRVDGEAAGARRTWTSCAMALSAKPLGRNPGPWKRLRKRIAWGFAPSRSTVPVRSRSCAKRTGALSLRDAPIRPPPLDPRLDAAMAGTGRVAGQVPRLGQCQQIAPHSRRRFSRSPICSSNDSDFARRVRISPGAGQASSSGNSACTVSFMTLSVAWIDPRFRASLKVLVARAPILRWSIQLLGDSVEHFGEPGLRVEAVHLGGTRANRLRSAELPRGSRFVDPGSPFGAVCCIVGCRC